MCPSGDCRNKQPTGWTQECVGEVTSLVHSCIHRHQQCSLTSGKALSSMDGGGYRPRTAFYLNAITAEGSHTVLCCGLLQLWNGKKPKQQQYFWDTEFRCQVIILIEENQGIAGAFPPAIEEDFCAAGWRMWGVGMGWAPRPARRVPPAGGFSAGKGSPAVSVFKGKVWDREGSLQLHVPLANAMMQQENPSVLLFLQFQSGMKFFTIQNTILIMKVVICNSNIYTESSFSYVFLHKVTLKSKCEFHFIQLWS